MAAVAGGGGALIADIDFSKIMVCPHGQGMRQCGQEGKFK